MQGKWSLPDRLQQAGKEVAVVRQVHAHADSIEFKEELLDLAEDLWAAEVTSTQAALRSHLEQFVASLDISKYLPMPQSCA